MDRSKQWLYGSISAIAVLLLIIDSKTAFSGAQEGITLCINSLIPSLFPFLIFTNIMTSVFVGKRIPGLRFITKPIGIPDGAESLMILGVLGGYPVGAQAVYEAYQSGQIEKETAERLIGFCSNAGPAFIFGIVGSLFSKPVWAWMVWIVHIISAYLTGLLLPGKINQHSCLTQRSPVSFSDAMKNSLRTIAVICGWVIIFRMISCFLNRWVLWKLPIEAAASLIGILELTNGCIALNDISSEYLKFVISCGLLSFGGLCVWMQTVSVTKDLETGTYLYTKTIQCSFSILFAGIAMLFKAQYTDQRILLSLLSFTLVLLMLLFFSINRKKVVALCR